jgi:hypothetical protein
MASLVGSQARAAIFSVNRPEWTKSMLALWGKPFTLYPLSFTLHPFTLYKLPFTLYPLPFMLRPPLSIIHPPPLRIQTTTPPFKPQHFTL